MWLIADGGSTKCDWVLLNSTGKTVFKTQTKGLNPTVFLAAVIEERLHSNQDLLNVKSSVEKLFFYGAGCGTQNPKNRLHHQLAAFFQNAEVLVEEDMKGAVLAVTHQPGLVCILGTGSNSCYFDGKKTHMKFASLGYVLMDEASGNYFGKQLLQDYFYQQMPKDLRLEFEQIFDLDPDTIKTNLYNKETPNAYLASFAAFIFGSNQKHPYFYQLLYKGIELFVQRHILCYEEAKNKPIHFIGSLAYLSKNVICEVAKKHQLSIGEIIKRPIDGLINHFSNKIIQDLQKPL